MLPDGFPTFVEHIFSQSKEIFKNQTWTGGEFPYDIAKWMGIEPRTLRVSAKDHFKSLSFYAHIMWKILRMYYSDTSREINYFSYKENMAAYHLIKIKNAIKCNPYFAGCIDMKPTADSILSYSWNGRQKLTVHPRGLLEFKRGIHCHDVYVDDPFQDPESKLVPTKIMKINATMKTQILDMFQNECHIAGTAQTNNDFFFDEDFVSRFSRRILPAEKDGSNKIALWPEWMSWEELKAKERERGQKVYRQEYLCSPVYTEDAFLDKDALMERVNTKLPNYTFEAWRQEVQRRKEEAKKEKKTYIARDMVAGWDLGKKGHPAHFTVFERKGDMRTQRHERWFDKQDYTAQLEYIKEAMDVFGIYRIFYDSTRGELEMLVENGTLPGEFEGIPFTFKGKHSMSAALDRAMSKKQIQFLNSPRMLNQMLVVNNDLQAPATPEGHGDSFWSICLSFMDTEAEGVDIHLL